MRRWLSFDVAGATCAATLDDAAGSHALLIVSGGNEIRSGAHRGMASLASTVAATGHPVLRFDRRGIGDSEGDNGGFESSGADIAAAIALLRATCPQVTRITGFGNCDAASALLLHHRDGGVDALVLANPWTIELDGQLEPKNDSAATANQPGDLAPALPPAAAIRARYMAKLKDPREWWRLARGGVDLFKLFKGLKAVSASISPSDLAARLAQAGGEFSGPLTLLIATNDGTAQAFMALWPTATFAAMRTRAKLLPFDTASHSFADAASRAWLEARVLESLAG